MYKYFLSSFLILMFTFNTHTVSLWSDNSGISAEYRPMFSIGDIVEVKIDETTTANQNTKTEIKDESSRTSNVFGKLKNVLKLSNLGYANTLLNRVADNLQDASQKTNVKGDGKVTASATLEAAISVIVKKILPNGNLYIEGTKTVKINSESTIVKLSGILRPQDIVANSISSNQVADAEINLIGKGSFDGTRRPGAIQRFFNKWF
ncbi:MAG: flagellar basal body L-ring protein FlgH [Candidatus Cloacimonetes bacterium]|nr:flagellar basal body L-ring protein FlgH [Candidatus Cloacimonadota bacterium]